MQIDHEPNEPKIDRSKGGWLSTFAVLGLAWAGYLYFNEFQWWPVAIGLGTGVLLTAWAIDITSNKVPESWRKKP